MTILRYTDVNAFCNVVYRDIVHCAVRSAPLSDLISSACRMIAYNLLNTEVHRISQSGIYFQKNNSRLMKLGM